MLTDGVQLTVVSEILGHSPTAITGDVYGTSRPTVRGVRRLSEVLADSERAFPCGESEMDGLPAIAAGRG